MRIDHRTLAEQGIDRIPQIHIGPKVPEMERRDIKAEIGGQALAIECRNEAIAALARQTWRQHAMSAIMKLRQARNVEQIAEELEPLAVSLATLADQAQASIKNVEAASLQQAREWSSQQQAQRASGGSGQDRGAARQGVAAGHGQPQADSRRGAAGTERQLWTLATVAGVSAILQRRCR